MDFRSEYAEKRRNPKAAEAVSLTDEDIRILTRPRRENLLTAHGERVAGNVLIVLICAPTPAYLAGAFFGLWPL